LQEEGKLRLFENKVLRRIFGPKREEGAGGCIRLHNQDFQNFCSSPDTFRVIRSKKLR
jgi:hypothetical protein